MLKPALAAAVIALFMVADVLALRLDASFVRSYTDEDGLIEYLGALCLAVGTVFALLAFRRSGRAPAGRIDARIKRLSYLGLALFLLLALGEEISWGQRLLGIGTPQALAEINAQGEINFHNLYGNSNGQNASDLIFKAFWFGFGVVLPLVAAASRTARSFLGRYLPVVPLWLAVLFVFQQLLWQPVQASWRANPSAWHGTYRGTIGGQGEFRVNTPAEAAASGMKNPAGLSEVMETNLELLLAIGALLVYRRALPANSRRTGPSVVARGDVALSRGSSSAPRGRRRASSASH